MFIGKFHIENGLLLRQRGSLILQLDGGGRWRLGTDQDLEAHLGRRVRVEGVRSGRRHRGEQGGEVLVLRGDWRRTLRPGSAPLRPPKAIELGRRAGDSAPPASLRRLESFRPPARATSRLRGGARADMYRCGRRCARLPVCCGSRRNQERKIPDDSTSCRVPLLLNSGCKRVEINLIGGQYTMLQHPGKHDADKRR